MLTAKLVRRSTCIRCCRDLQARRERPYCVGLGLEQNTAQPQERPHHVWNVTFSDLQGEEHSVTQPWRLETKTSRPLGNNKCHCITDPPLGMPMPSATPSHSQHGVSAGLMAETQPSGVTHSLTHRPREVCALLCLVSNDVCHPAAAGSLTPSSVEQCYVQRHH
jgi:hypothetical protein